MGKVAKCDFCRRDKKKCTWSQKSASTSTAGPTDLSERCDWCIKFRFPCSKRRLANEIIIHNDTPTILVPRIEVRPTIDIVRDIDCILYMLAGILDYGDHHIKITPISNGWESLPQESHLLEKNPSSILGMDSPLYQDPTEGPGTDVLYQNFEKFHKLQIFCKGHLEAELEKLRKESNAVVEYLSTRNKLYEAAALVNVMATSPWSYTTKSIEARNAHRAHINSPYLGALAENEKNCGQLFLYIKAATIPSARYTLPYTPAVQYRDIKAAQGILHRLIKDRLQGTLVQTGGVSRSDHRTVYHQIDPLEHRACFLKDENLLLEPDWHDSAAISQENLLGEAGTRIIRKYNLNSPVVAMVCHDSLEVAGGIAVDIRGMDIVLALVFDGHWSETVADMLHHPIWRCGPRSPRKGAFFSDTEVPGLAEIRKAFPNPFSNHWVHLDAFQLATLMGNLFFIEQLEAVAPDLSKGIYIRPAADDNDDIFRYMKCLVPEPMFGEYHPVVLSALAGYTRITRYYLDKDPILSKPQSEGGALEALLLIAFKRGSLELLYLLNEGALIGLDGSKRIMLSRQAVELAAPDMFHTWMNLAWFDLNGPVWGAMGSIRCQLWQAILSSLWAQYEGTQGIQNREIQNEKVRFFQVICAMEQSMYLARCGCSNCQGYYVGFRQTLGSFEQSG
ncbi:hypothetical protein TWF281_010247 [Arthrobotrys megalospora]